jgi:hypothetical protein
MKEKVKRLQPKMDVLRELYLKSGNECAFPDCERKIISAAGEFIGQLCHIEAAEKGGQRFNENESNEQRRTFQNLLLMCYEHHVTTNDVDMYDVPAMKRIKSDHESKFSNVLTKIQNSFERDAESGAPILILIKSDMGTQKDSRIYNDYIRQSTPALATFDFKCTYGGSAHSIILNHTNIFTEIKPISFASGDTISIIAELTPYDNKYVFNQSGNEQPLKIECITLKGKKVIIELDFNGYKVTQRL